MEDTSRFGKNVAAIREQLGIPRTELQRRLADNGTDMHMTTLRRIESGEQEPKISEALALANALGVAVDLLNMDLQQYPDLTQVEITLARYKEAVKEAVFALSNWGIQGSQLIRDLARARENGVPDKLLYEASNFLGRSNDLDALTFLWDDSMPKPASDWLEVATKEANGKG